MKYYSTSWYYPNEIGHPQHNLKLHEEETSRKHPSTRSTWYPWWRVCFAYIVVGLQEINSISGDRSMCAIGIKYHPADKNRYTIFRISFMTARIERGNYYCYPPYRVCGSPSQALQFVFHSPTRDRNGRIVP